MPRKSNVSQVSAAGDDGTPAKEKDGVNIEDLSLPRSMVQRLAKGVLPPNTQIQKDAITAMSKGATVFVSYIADKANEITRDSNRKTISPNAVLDALAECEFADFLPRVEAELKRFNEIATGKRNEYRRKVKEKETGAGGANGAIADDDDDDDVGNNKAVKDGAAADHSLRGAEMGAGAGGGMGSDDDGGEVAEERARKRVRREEHEEEEGDEALLEGQLRQEQARLLPGTTTEEEERNAQDEMRMEEGRGGGKRRRMQEEEEDEEEEEEDEVSDDVDDDDAGDRESEGGSASGMDMDMLARLRAIQDGLSSGVDDSGSEVESV
ncbi:MAG: hypothetical protein LQ345_004291 [Seirophora villosa]|nr:MAG: hypothetical protein LQ345_004291 [Seirophora villosa]